MVKRIILDLALLFSTVRECSEQGVSNERKKIIIFRQVKMLVRYLVYFSIVENSFRFPIKTMISISIITSLFLIFQENIYSIDNKFFIRKQW
jgi:hypothetical protein